MQVRVKVISARQLKAVDLNGKSDPYVIIRLGSQTKKTKIIQKNLSPSWNEEFILNVTDPNSQSLVFEVRDHDMLTNDDPLGHCIFPLNNLTRGQELTSFFNLVNGAGGQLKLSLFTNDFGREQPHRAQQQIYGTSQSYSSQQQPMYAPQQSVYAQPPQQQPPQVYATSQQYVQQQQQQQSIPQQPIYTQPHPQQPYSHMQQSQYRPSPSQAQQYVQQHQQQMQTHTTQSMHHAQQQQQYNHPSQSIQQPYFPNSHAPQQHIYQQSSNNGQSSFMQPNGAYGHPRQ